MRIFFLILIFFLKLNVALAQEEITFEGRIIDEEGEALDDVKVSITGFGWKYTTDSGEFEFNLPTPEYEYGDVISVHFSKDGYKSGPRDIPILRDPIDITMEKLGEVLPLYGKVIGEENEPLQSVRVTIIGVDPCSTSSNGEFRLELPSPPFNIGDTLTLDFSKDGWKSRSIKCEIPFDPIQNPVIVTMKELEKVLNGKVLNEENEPLENVRVNIIGGESCLTSCNGEFSLKLPTSTDVGDTIRIHFSKYGYQFELLKKPIPSDYSIHIIMKKTKPLNISLILASGSINYYNQISAHSLLQYFYERFSIGIAISGVVGTYSCTYNTLPNLPPTTVKEWYRNLYFGLLMHYFLKKHKTKCVEPYIGLIVGMPPNSQLVIGSNLKTFGNKVLGLECRIMYYKIETSTIEFNRYGDALEESLTDYDFRITVGITLGLNF